MYSLFRIESAGVTVTTLKSTSTEAARISLPAGNVVKVRSLVSSYITASSNTSTTGPFTGRTGWCGLAPCQHRSMGIICSNANSRNLTGFSISIIGSSQYLIDRILYQTTEGKFSRLIGLQGQCFQIREAGSMKHVRQHCWLQIQ
jgi:hypothetical protein